jgi:hypothetical protein
MERTQEQVTTSVWHTFRWLFGIRKRPGRMGAKLRNPSPRSTSEEA